MPSAPAIPLTLNGQPAGSANGRAHSAPSPAVTVSPSHRFTDSSASPQASSPTPQAPSDPSAISADSAFSPALLDDYVSAELSPRALAARHNITVEQLLDHFDDPPVPTSHIQHPRSGPATLLDRLERFAHRRAAVIGAIMRPEVLRNLYECMHAAPIGTETHRRACTTLLRVIDSGHLSRDHGRGRRSAVADRERQRPGEGTGPFSTSSHTFRPSVAPADPRSPVPDPFPIHRMAESFDEHRSPMPKASTEVRPWRMGCPRSGSPCNEDAIEASVCPSCLPAPTGGTALTEGLGAGESSNTSSTGVSRTRPPVAAVAQPSGLSEPPPMAIAPTAAPSDSPTQRLSVSPAHAASAPRAPT